MMHLKRLAALLIAALLLWGATGCAARETQVEDILVAQVGNFERSSGPSHDPETGVDFAIYRGGSGEVTLRARRVGEENIDHALSQLPLAATDVRYDPGLGPRSGLFFNFAGGYHAAWGNGAWVFVLSSNSEDARAAFLAAYSY